jgi:RNA polymerase subunit RPABC4/transcription elongation factor Spt4
MKRAISVEKERVWCERCQRWLQHDRERCPLFPQAAGVKKWSECVCLIHTCFDAVPAKKRSKRNAATYRDLGEKLL